MKLTVATCQFPTDKDISRNLRHVLRQMKTAGARGADVAHFSETCLAGYAGSELKSFDGYDWDLLLKSTRQIMDLAARLRLWVILGSNHRLTGRHKPHNSLYIINSRGRIVDRYDKCFCCGRRSGKTDDLKYYSPGDHFCVFTIKGVRCGALICHDLRYDELYRQYKKRGVRLMFHSYHMGHVTKAKIRRSKQMYESVVPSTMQAYAANNYVWISASNTSARESPWPSFFVAPEGQIIGRLRNNVTGVLINTVDTARKFYDASAAWRDRCIRGVYHSGKVVSDKRSADRTRL